MTMKARITQKNGEVFLEVTPGEPKVCSTRALQRFLTSFTEYIHQDGTVCWDTNPYGEVLAYVSESNELIVCDPQLFKFLFPTADEYITVVEFAARHGKQRRIITRFCQEGRIPGAFQKDRCWYIPADASYPKHGSIKK